MFFLLLLVPVLGFTQSDESVAAFLKSRPDSLGKLVSALNNRDVTRLYLIRELGMKRKYIFSVSTNADYRTVFGFYPKGSLPVFDFLKQELVVYAACGQCMIGCTHHGNNNESCHRNACYFQEAWYAREKKE